jgi:hypothetical protein
MLGALAVVGACWMGPAPTTPALPPDPDAIPPMRAPYGQPRHDSHRFRFPSAPVDARDRRIALTVLPMFASFRVPFIGRPAAPIRGGGVGLELDVLMWRPLWLRATVSHTAHRGEDAFTRNDDDALVQTAGRGAIQATHAGLGLAWGLDFGRVLPLVDVGVGALWVRSPKAVAEGQMGGACRSDGSCDTGLRCGIGNMCRVGTIAEVHIGLAIDVLVARRFSLGAGLRYFALLSAPTNLPLYLTVALRAGIRF